MTSLVSSRRDRRGGVPWRSLLSWLAVLAITAGLLAAAIIPYTGLVRHAAERQMSTDSTLVADLLDEQSRTLDGVITSQISELDEGLQSADPAARQRTMDQVLQSLHRVYPEMYSVLLTDRNGQLLQSIPPGEPNRDLSARPWFIGASSSSQAFISPLFNAITGDRPLVISVSVAVRPGGVTRGPILGVLAILIPVGQLQDVAVRYSTQNRAVIHILDRNGVVAGDGDNRAAHQGTLEQRRADGRALLAGGDDISGTARSGSGAWTVVSQEPAGIALRSATIFRNVAIAVALAALLALWLFRRTRDRFRRARAQAEADAAEGQRLVAALVESSPDVMVRVSSTGQVLNASAASLDVLGIAPDDLVGQSIFDLLATEAGTGVRQEIDHLLATGERVNFSATTPRRAGHTLDCSFSILPASMDAGLTGAQPLSDRTRDDAGHIEVTLLGALRDVTARATARDQVEQLFQLSQDFMAVMDVEGRLVQVNPVWTAALGLPRELVVGHRFTDVFAAGMDAGAFDPGQLADGSLDQTSFETRYVAPGQIEPRVLLWTVAPDARHELVYAVGRDITAHKELERALGEARDQALEASRLKSEFVATMSHEIRTPMNGVIGLTDLLALTPLDETQMRYVDGVRTAGDALLSVINDILDFSKIEADRLVLDHVDFRLHDVTGDVITLVRSSAEAKGLELGITYADDLPATVNGDPGRVRQILLNLAHNAVKFTADGSVHLTVRNGPARSDNRVSVLFDVTDTGIGIEAGKLQQLFEPFRQADEGVTRAYGGTGLGLSISLRLAEMMGGAISVSSEPGRGTTFTVELLFSPAREQETISRGADVRGLGVLVVDDNEVNRLVMETQLTSWGMRPVTARSAAEALELLTQPGREHGFDLAVIDMHMPEGSGLDLARDIRAVPALASLPLILLTSDEGVDTESAATHDIAATLTKPVQQSALFDALSRVPVTPSAPSGARAETRDPQRDSTRILLVEDNEINQTVALGILGTMGYRTVDVASDGSIALDLTAQQDYDVILMDCQMPVLDGYSATIRLRVREAEQAQDLGRPVHTPVIAMTAATFAADRQRCFDAGMDDFVGKPVRAPALKAALERWLARDPAGPLPPPGPGLVPLQTTAEQNAGSPAPVNQENPVSNNVPEPRSSDAGDDPIAERVNELLGDGSELEVELVQDIVSSFLTRSGELLTSLDEAVTAGDLEAVHLHAHTLVGAGLNLGAEQIAFLGRQIEAGAKTGSLGPALENLPPLRAAVQDARSRLEALLQTLPA